MFHSYLSSPLGILAITSNGEAVTHIEHVKKTGVEKSDSVTKQCVRELREYFDGKRKSFDVRIEPAGTQFQEKVWTALRKISYGETITYGALAKAVGKPKSARAIGSACGKNPILILTPCHRVIASDGALGGFSAGIARKKILLTSEGVSFKK